MRSLVTSCAVGKIDGQLVTDLSGIEDKAGEADLPVAMTWFNDEISLLQFDGKVSKDELDEFLEMAEDSLNKVYQIQLDALKRKYEQIRDDVQKDGGEPEE
jgi:exosome complex component RRP41